MKIGIVGMGYWGPNLVRNFLATSNVEGVVCCDMSEKRLQLAKRKFPSVELTASYEDLLSRDDIDAVAVATPVSTHFPLGMKALEAGKHLLLEKPMTGSTEEAMKLIEAAAQRNLTLMVDHTFIYTGAVRKIKELVVSGKIGDILYFDSVRVNLGLFQHDTNVIWDLAPHDLSIMDYVIGREPVAVTAVGVNHFNDVEDIAYLTVQYADRLIAHFHVNWLSPVKIRKILIGGSKLMVVYDDMETSEKIKVYDKGVEIRGEESIHKTLVQYRTGDMHAPQIDQTEALSLLTAEFVDSIIGLTRPTSDGQSGMNVVRILEAAEASLRAGGKQIELSGKGVFA
jgi:predicted dehydrogenase